MSYVKSGDIKLYPCSNRGGEYNPEARLGTEFNITKMNSAIASRKSFVIEYKDNYIEFSINGYYFRIDNISTYLPNTEELYANIKIGDKGDDSYHLPNLQSLISETNYELDHTDNTFVGLSLTDKPSSDCESLLLLKKYGDIWNVPLTSKLYKSGEDILPDTEDQNIGSESLKFNKIYANSLHGTADKAKEFNEEKSITLSGHITGTVSSTGVNGWTISTTIPSDTVKTAMISNSQVTTDKINNLAVTTAKLANDSVTEDKIAFGTITDDSISNSANIDGSKIKDASIDGNKLMPNTIGSEHLGDIITTGSSESNGISVSLTQGTRNVGGLNITLSCNKVNSAGTADKLLNTKNFSITGDVNSQPMPFDGTSDVRLYTTISKINGQNILGTKQPTENGYIDDGIFVSESSNQVKKAKFADTAGEVTTIKEKQIENKHLNGAIITTNNIEDEVITSNKIADDAIITSKYKDHSITGAKLAANISISTTGTITATSFYATSDERLKENIIDYKYHNSILDLPVKQFNYKSDPTKTTIGCIAQELQVIYPELVETDKDGYLKIAENKLVYLLLEEVKLLKEEIKQLKEGN